MYGYHTEKHSISIQYTNPNLDEYRVLKTFPLNNGQTEYTVKSYFNYINKPYQYWFLCIIVCKEKK